MTTVTFKNSHIPMQSFGKLPRGVYFVYCEELYIKIDEGANVRGAHLITGELYNLAGNTQVEIVAAEIIVTRGTTNET